MPTSTIDIKTYPLYLDGQWIDFDEHIEVTNPATGQVFARVAKLNRKDVATAIDHAQKAFMSWRKVTGKQRSDYLNAIANQLALRTEEIAQTITKENGKPLPQSRGEVNMMIDHYHWFAGEARRIYGRMVPHQVEGKRHLILKSPVGVVGAISPWNFPVVLATRKLAPALAAGCTVLLKPASATPLSSVLLAECIEAAGVPRGVFQLIAGSAQDIGAEFMENPLCRKVSFTGSTEVGKSLIEQSARTVTAISMELGGNAPMLVFGDADLDRAVAGAIIAKFRNTGQSCVAANRIYVQRNIYDQFLAKFLTAAKSLKVGSGLEPDVEIGPLIDDQAIELALELIADAQACGAKVLYGGHRIKGSGTFLAPTVLADVPPTAKCMNCEIFAPIAPICPFDDEAEGISHANATEYGLAAYVYTNDLARALRLSEELDAGTIGLNDAVPAVSTSPFGGCKESGLGRELGTEGIEPYLETKHISIGGVD